MHVLFVGFVWPEPLSSAAGQNILSYINACLAAKWQVSFCSAAETTTQSADLQSINVNTFNANLNCSSFNQQVEKLSPDIVIFDRFLSFEQFAWRVRKVCPNAALVIDTEDLHGLRKARQILCSQLNDHKNFMQSQDILDKKYQSILFNELTRRELACILQADLSIVLSKQEHAILESTFKVSQNQIVHLPFILSNHESTTLSKIEFSDKKDFVFIGNYRHAPNYHALKFLREQCWPIIYKQIKQNNPEVSCHIYGAYSSGKVQQLESKALRFFVHGFAPKQFDVIADARIMLAPITFGAGVKGKLLDAMLCNTPSITTPIGIEGITERPWPGGVSNTVDEFVERACELYLNKSKWTQACLQAKTILTNDYNKEMNEKNFLDALQTCVLNLSNNRQQNILQQILNERQFQANKYMGQWIEAKNK